MKFRHLALGIALSFAAVPAFAGSCTAGLSAAICVAAKTTSAGYRVVTIDNESTGNIGVTDDNSTPVIGAAGTYTIGPGQTRVWGMANTLYPGPFKLIGSAASQAVTYTAQ